MVWDQVSGDGYGTGRKLNEQSHNRAVDSLEELAALVLCKRELFYQTAAGKTIKTDYYSSPAKAEQLAKHYGVEWSEQ